MKKSPVQPGKRFARQPNTPAITNPTIVADETPENDDMTTEAATIAAADLTAATPPSADVLAAATDTALANAADGTVEAAPTSNPNLITFKVPNHGEVTVDLEKMSGKVRAKLMANAVTTYVKNRVSTMTSAAGKANEAWEKYDGAQAFNPEQTFVPKPETARKEVDVSATVQAAIDAMYNDQMGAHVRGESKPKADRDPVLEHITRTVVTELFNKRHAADSTYKYMSAKELRLALMVWHGCARRPLPLVEAGLSDAKSEEVRIQTQYINTARVMLGLDVADKKLEKLPSLF